MLLLVLGLAACADPPAAVPSGSGPERAAALGPFLAEHWRLPVPAQGERPQGFSEAEASLAPAVCGSCHPEQFAQWRTSLHARAYSPGFAGQLIEGDLAHPLELRGCQTCHAPLEEQQPYDATLQGNPLYDAELRAQGIVCASCHVRAHRRFGPPRRPELPPLVEPAAHGGFEERAEYRESRFCAECHQFFDDPGPAGKSLENTFFEWQESPQAAQGRHCQECHMPDRAHLWRGIHDAEMVRSGVDSELVALDLAAATLRAALVVRNRDVGHAFPTYTTPRVFLTVYQADAGGAELADTRVEAALGRDVDLGQMVERSDTRVAPGESVKLDYALPRAALAASLVGRVTVDPDFHYRGVFAQLGDIYSTAEARALIARAAAEVADSSYVLYETRLGLP